MKRYMVFLTVAAVWFAAGCSENVTGNSDNGGGGTVTDLTGTWALTQTVTGTDTADVQADSASMYIVIEGTAVTMHVYTPGAAPVVRTGTYTGSQLVFGTVTYTVQAEDGVLDLRDAADSTVTYGCSVFTGTVPPAYWPVGDVEDDTYEPVDDDMQGATVLTAGTVQAHTIRNGDQDWFRVTVRTGYVHTVSVEGSTDAYGLRVFDADSNRVFSWLGDGVVIDEDAGTVTFTPVAQKVYYIRLQGNESAVYTIGFASVVIPASPYTGTWYLAADTLMFGSASSVAVETLAFTENTTIEIVEFSGSRLIRHLHSVEGTWSDTMVFIYVNATTAVVNGDTVGIWRSGSGIRVYMDMGYANYVSLQSRRFLPYAGSIPPAHWNSTPVTQQRKPAVMRP